MAHRLIGAGGASGLALGPAYRRLVPPIAHDLVIEDRPAALARLRAAQAAVAQRMWQLAERERASGRNESGLIFEFLSFLAEDPALTDLVAQQLHAGIGLGPALHAATHTLAAQIAGLDDEYQRGRADDITALGREIAGALAGSQPTLPPPPPGVILVSEDLSPAELAELAELADRPAGLVLAAGSPTGHTAILARARGIPTVVGVGAAALEIPSGTELALDGDAALLLIQPEPAERASFIARLARPKTTAVLPTGPATLADGTHIQILANISRPAEAASALAHGAAGVGLFRTEFLFLERTAPPGEEEQYAAYRATLEALQGRPLVVRTLDIGGDKSLPYLSLPHEANPALGLRGLRLFMHHPDLLITQLRALLRAASHGDLRIMLPMITTPADLAWGRAQIAAVAQTLSQQAIVHRANPPLGAMIETPAAAVTIDLLAPFADFFSLGTNDLAQYTLGADRLDGVLAARYPTDAPAVLRLVGLATTAARRAARPMSVCGELAGMPNQAAALVGLGITSLSMAPAAIAAVHARLSQITLRDAEALMQHWDTSTD